MNISLENTLLFQVFDSHENDDGDTIAHFIPSLAVIDRKSIELASRLYSQNILKKNFKRNLERYGYSVLRNIYDPSLLLHTRNVIISEFFEKKLLPTYDLVNDEFDGFDAEENNVTRMPRIGNGKHNIHFDPEFSSEHKALDELVASSPVLKLLSHYMGYECSLRECGISATRPKASASFVDKHPNRAFGEGMQWHSDGADGEATMLLSFDGISEDMGVLKLVPRSYMEYVDGIGYDEEIVESRVTQLDRRAAKYCYEPGNPVIFDARTMHGVENNISNRWRLFFMSFKKPKVSLGDMPSKSEASSKQPNDDKPTLSKSVMGMKFMQKKSFDVVETNSPPMVVGNRDVNNSNSRIHRWERDMSQVSFPGRRSFGGCNKFIERHYAKVLEDQYNIKLSERESKTTISDEEMIKRYEELVSLPRGPNQGMRRSKDVGMNKSDKNKHDMANAPQAVKKKRKLEEDTIPMKDISMKQSSQESISRNKKVKH